MQTPLPQDRPPVVLRPPPKPQQPTLTSSLPQAAPPPAASAAPSPSPTVPSEKPAAPAPAPAAAAPAGAVSVAGKVVFKGDAPEAAQIDMSAVKECAAHHPDGAFNDSLVVNGNGTLKNVLVRVTAGLPDGQSFAPPAAPVKLDQKGCQYVPHVVGVMVGQPLMVANSDAFLHNVHALSNVNPAFNFGQPNKDPGRRVEPPKAAEVFKVKCDVHPWMGAWVHVVDHPFFSVTGDDGSFSLRGLPAGTYTLTAWHETLGERQQQVTVEEGKPATAEFTFEPK